MCFSRLCSRVLSALNATLPPVKHSSEALTPQLMLDYLTELGAGLMSSGCPTHRLEELLTTVAGLEGFHCDVFALPTGLTVSIRTPQGEPSVVSMVRVKDWGTDLEKLVDYDTVLNQVADRKLSVADARIQLRQMQTRKSGWPDWIQIVAGMGASAGAAVSFGGGSSDFFFAGVGGLLVRALIWRLRSIAGIRFLENFLGGLMAGLIAWVTTLIWPAHSREVLVLSIVIPLLPGMMLTTGLSELTSKNLVAGSARLMDAGVTLLSLILGIALVLSIESKLNIRPEAAVLGAPAGLPWQLLGLAVTGLSSGVILLLPKRFLALSLVSCAVVWLSQALLRQWPGPQAAFLTATALAVSANVYARVKSRPAQLFLLPGLLLLVPGSFGFRSLDAVLRGNYMTGASQLVDMFLTAGALVMGLLVSNVLVPPNKHL